MNASEPNSRLWRLTGHLDKVVVLDGHNTMHLNPGRAVVRIAGDTAHPTLGNLCRIGEVVGGRWDGMRFAFPPGVEHPDVWCQVAEDV